MRPHHKTNMTRVSSVAENGWAVWTRILVRGGECVNTDLEQIYNSPSICNDWFFVYFMNN